MDPHPKPLGMREEVAENQKKKKNTQGQFTLWCERIEKREGKEWGISLLRRRRGVIIMGIY